MALNWTKKTENTPKEIEKREVGVEGIKGNFRMVATCMQNLEDELASEISALGGENVTNHKRAVSFEGDKKKLYEANIWLRTALKVLVPIDQFKVFKENQLYNKAKEFCWEEYFSEDQTFVISHSVHSTVFTHSQYAALKLKDAIADRFTEKFGKRPSVDRTNADVQIHLHINENMVDISLDSSGEPLFKRGYRVQGHLAPINESLAAGLIMKSDWDYETDFYDPMCGSATIAIEAAMLAQNIAPNYNRTRFAFESWKEFDSGLFSEVLHEAKKKYKPLKCKIMASDKSPRSIRLARQNINAANMRKSIELEEKDFFDSKPPTLEGLLLFNPPYGERMKTDNELFDFYSIIGDTFKRNYSGWTAWLISSEIDALKSVGLKTSRKIPMMNGKLECQFRNYQMYTGSRKASKNTEN